MFWHYIDQFVNSQKSKFSISTTEYHVTFVQNPSAPFICAGFGN